MTRGGRGQNRGERRDGPAETPLLTRRSPLEQAGEALGVAAGPASGSGKVMLRLSAGAVR
ncbi:hypothetical protein GCM10023220_70240 [Streptomyces ziwulingensis]|uniref:Uncharacterized protein n=1 Tax=Streptomyces ziwulingensis TaxID=1045501 RepID=A0ABP9D2N1_9ACTN